LLKRIGMLALAALAAAAVVVVAGAATSGAGDPPRLRYIALGDSLAAGAQPDEHGRDVPTLEGYADDVAATLDFELTKLSCGGATTQTLIDGGAGCQPDGQAGQLPRAEAFLHRHPGTALVTLDVGDNDVEHCLKNEAAVNWPCVRAGLRRIGRNLPVIVQRLQAAAGKRTRLVGVVDYDQFLAFWLDGADGRRAARRSARVIERLNGRMTAIYRAAGVPVADASARFAISDLTSQRTLPGHGTVPLAVYRTCRWTWACSGEDPVGDDHANAAGYRQIAAAVLDVLPDRL
jgi:lysophospholipase L1-like esterase